MQLIPQTNIDHDVLQPQIETKKNARKALVEMMDDGLITHTQFSIAIQELEAGEKIITVFEGGKKDIDGNSTRVVMEIK